jgi:hypothetical protein
MVVERIPALWGLTRCTNIEAMWNSNMNMLIWAF